MIRNINSKFTRMADHSDFGRLLLRLVVGILILFHGQAKMVHGVGWISDLLQARHFPGFLAYGAYIGEIIAPLLVIIGVLTRPAALIMAINMLIAVMLISPSMIANGTLWSRTDVGAWTLEVEAFYFFCSVAIMCLGAGKYTFIKNEQLR